MVDSGFDQLRSTRVLTKYSWSFLGPDSINPLRRYLVPGLQRTDLLIYRQPCQSSPQPFFVPLTDENPNQRPSTLSVFETVSSVGITAEGSL